MIKALLGGLIAFAGVFIGATGFVDGDAGRLIVGAVFVFGGMFLVGRSV